MSDANSTHSEDRSRKFSLKSIFQGKDKDKAKSKNSIAHKEKDSPPSSALIPKNIIAQPVPTNSSVRVHSSVSPPVSEELLNSTPNKPELKEPKELKPVISAFNISGTVLTTAATIPYAAEAEVSESSKSKSTGNTIETATTSSPVESISKAVVVASAIAIVVFATFRFWSK
ncbi:hypothetical protein HK100_004069 [Physocladia obscura]|uniref:Uncharacterized protein n=1 Tax=Physocladia obscura TaxID=109957 RepID=A0AAD5X903_9FUNG|nr:hypothetical protein HK100_004069 [Physocladia obscura]